MVFEKKFFEEEESWGFRVERIQKLRRAALLEMYEEIEKICRENNLKYVIAYGTLLGAVRHKGFIPWDDDFDIWMERGDYEKLRQLIHTEGISFENKSGAVGKKLLYIDPYEMTNPHNTWLVITNNNSISFDEAFLSKYHGCPLAVSIDVFPLDYFPQKNSEVEAFLSIIEMIEILLIGKDYWDEKGYPVNAVVEGKIKEIENMCRVSIDRNKPVKKQLVVLIDVLSQIFNEEDGEAILSAAQYPADNEWFMREWFNETVLLDFEGVKMPAPCGYDEVLTSVYGDYMTPVNWDGHDGKQLDVVLKNIECSDKEKLKADILEISKKYI